MVLLEFAADLGELHQAGLHGQRQLAGGDHQTTVLVGVVGHWNPQSPAGEGGQEQEQLLDGTSSGWRSATAWCLLDI